MTKARDNANNWAADITGVTAGTGITGGGTSGTVTVTNELVTTIDAAGDLLYGTGSDAAARLGIGTAGQVLTVNSGATAPEWASPAGGGGYTQLATGTLSGASVSLTSIAATYQDLRLVLENPQISNTGQYVFLRFNNDTTVANYNTCGYAAAEGSSTAFQNLGNDAIISNVSGLFADGLIVTDIYKYATTTGYKVALNNAHHRTAATTFRASQMIIGYESTTAIDRIDIFAYNTTFTGGTYTLFGVN